MTTHAGTGIEGSEAKGLGFGSFDDFPDIDVHFIAEHGQFVNQAYIYITIGVF